MIDRTRFLFLTGLIATSVACTTRRTTARAAIDIGPASAQDPPPNEATVLDADGVDAGPPDADIASSAPPHCIGDEDTEPNCKASSCSKECAKIVKPRFKKGIANQILGCMEMYPSCESVSSCIIERGLPDPDSGRYICEDATAAVFCRPLVESCRLNGGKELTMPTCEAMARVLTSVGRRQLVSCVTRGTRGSCVLDSSTCLDAMTY